jgi:Recombinase
MADSRERMERLRQKRRAQGERAIEVWLDPASAARLADLRRPGESDSGVIRRALTALEARQANGSQPVTGDDTQARPSVTSAPASATSDTMNPLQRKATLLTRLRELKAQGLSLQAIANQLNGEGVPTLSGKGTWKKGTIANLLAKAEEP